MDEIFDMFRLWVKICRAVLSFVIVIFVVNAWVMDLGTFNNTDVIFPRFKLCDKILEIIDVLTEIKFPVILWVNDLRKLPILTTVIFVVNA